MIPFLSISETEPVESGETESTEESAVDTGTVVPDDKEAEKDKDDKEKIKEEEF